MPKVDQKVVIGVTGRAGSGKTTFARMLAPNADAILDADKIAWELYRDKTIRKNIHDIFGIKVFNAEGGVDRKKLGWIVFADKEKLDQLNAIIHPVLVGELRHRIARSSQQLIIVDAALLLDWDLAYDCNLIIAVLSPDADAVKRLKAKRIKPEFARAILDIQRPAEEFPLLCHITVHNTGSLEELRIKAEKIKKDFILPLLES